MAFLHYFTRLLKYLEKKAVFLGTSYFLRQFLFFFLIIYAFSMSNYLTVFYLAIGLKLFNLEYERYFDKNL